MWTVGVPQSAAVFRAGDLRLTSWLKLLVLTAQSPTGHAGRYWKAEISRLCATVTSHFIFQQFKILLVL